MKDVSGSNRGLWWSRLPSPTSRPACERALVGPLILAMAWAILSCRDDETRQAEPAVVEAVEAVEVGEQATLASTAREGAEEVASTDAPSRARFDGSMPPVEPSARAAPGPLGIHHQTLREGRGPLPVEGHVLLVDLRAWDASGNLVTDTSVDPEPFALSWGALPEALHAKLAAQRVGTRLWLWLPENADRRLRMPSWPRQGRVRVEMQVVGTREPAATVRHLSSLRARPEFPPPSVDGPPVDAKSAPGGVRYWWLESGPEGTQARPGSQLSLLVSAYSMNGMVVTKVLSDQATRLTMGKAPAGLQPVLDRMIVGDTVRAWLPAGRAREVLPDVDSAAVMDVTLVQVR